MKFAIFGDIHANLHALQAVLADAHAQKCTHYVCTGDVVGYNAFPRECLEIIRNLECPVVKGNHDEHASTNCNHDGFNELAEESMKWTSDRLAEEDKQWLQSLRFIRTIRDFTVAHATLDTPQGWGYIFNQLDAQASFHYQKTQLCFVGHTHTPILYVREGNTAHALQYESFTLQPGRKYIVNVGSVGQPRDHDWRASYVTYDPTTMAVENHRIEYDVAAAQAAIRTANLPEKLAFRLEKGY